jgi:hypothetical protein
MTARNKYNITLTLISLLIVFVFFIQPPTSFLFQNAKGDCSGRSDFMYNALYTNKTNADVVLFGSSKTLNGINDSMLNRLGEETYLNLGYCRFGRNLDWFFIDEYCKTHQPKKLILEVRQQERDVTHPLTPFLLPLSDVAKSALSYNKDFFPDMYNKWLCHLKFLRSRIFNKTTSAPTVLEIKGGYWSGNGKPSIAELNTERFKDSTSMSTQKRDTILHSKIYFERLKKLCATRQIQLYFLYLSNYGNVKTKPDCYEVYKRYGTVICVPDSLLQNPLDFSDLGHFNLNGANKTSLWLATELKKY